MNKITREEFDQFVEDVMDGNAGEDFWSRIQEVQSSEPMSRDEFLDHMDRELGKGRRMFTEKELDVILPLTVQQGFIPDWSKAPKSANKLMGFWVDSNGGSFGGLIIIAERPERPESVMRPKTRQEKLNDLRNKIGFVYFLSEVSDATIDDICASAGVSLLAEDTDK